MKSIYSQLSDLMPETESWIESINFQLSDLMLEMEKCFCKSLFILHSVIELWEYLHSLGGNF